MHPEHHAQQLFVAAECSQENLCSSCVSAQVRDEVEIESARMQGCWCSSSAWSLRPELDVQATAIEMVSVSRNSLRETLCLELSRCDAAVE